MFRVTADAVREAEAILIADYRELLKHYHQVVSLYQQTGLAHPQALAMAYQSAYGVVFANVRGVSWLLCLYSSSSGAPIHNAYVELNGDFLHFAKACLTHRLLDAL